MLIFLFEFSYSQQFGVKLRFENSVVLLYLSKCFIIVYSIYILIFIFTFDLTILNLNDILFPVVRPFISLYFYLLVDLQVSCFLNIPD